MKIMNCQNGTQNSWDDLLVGWALAHHTSTACFLKGVGNSIVREEWEVNS